MINWSYWCWLASTGMRKPTLSWVFRVQGNAVVVGVVGQCWWRVSCRVIDGRGYQLLLVWGLVLVFVQKYRRMDRSLFTGLKRKRG
jgi:hypothetical protein